MGIDRELGASRRVSESASRAVSWVRVKTKNQVEEQLQIGDPALLDVAKGRVGRLDCALVRMVCGHRQPSFPGPVGSDPIVRCGIQAGSGNP